MGQPQARRILVDMPYVDDDFYHQFRWRRPIPQPGAYGDMIVTTTSRRANHNEQPRRRDNTPRRDPTPRRAKSRRRHMSLRSSVQQCRPGPPRVFAPFKQPTHPPEDHGWPRSSPLGMDPHQNWRRNRHTPLHPTIRTTHQTTCGSHPTSQGSLEHLLLANSHADASRCHLQASQHGHHTGHRATHRHPLT